MQIAVIGAGWAGLAAAVAATRQGHHVTVFEAARQLGGRARRLQARLPDGRPVTLDNGQHILIGAYTETLALMQQVGVDPAQVLLRLPLRLCYPDGPGFALPQHPSWPPALSALAGVLGAGHWSWRERLALLGSALRWQLAGFACPADWTVATLSARLGPQVRQDLIEPLCVSALNTPAQRASGQVFLRVLRDALFGVRGGADLLLPRTDLSAVWPEAAARWLQARGSHIRLGARVTELVPCQPPSGSVSSAQARPGSISPAQARAIGNAFRWQVQQQDFDAVVLATSSSDAVKTLTRSASLAPENIASQWATWLRQTAALSYEAIATVYTWHPAASLDAPMLALHSSPACPAQFVFDRGQLGGPAGLLAWVVSASTADRDEVQAQVLAQASATLGLPLMPVQTVVERRATFACTPGLVRPASALAPGLWACGDYVQGPYPATLEGAVRSGLGVANQLEQARGSTQ